jgi:hypothetical protein
MSTKRVDIKEQSRLNYTVFIEEGKSMPDSDITFGVLLRIADATELMATNHQKLLNDVEYYKKEKTYYYNKYLESQRSKAAYKARVTRLKNQLRAANQTISELTPAYKDSSNESV